MPLPTLNRRQTSVRQQRRRHLLLPLLATVLALAGLATSSPAKYNFNVTKALRIESSTWMEPCGYITQGSIEHVQNKSFTKSTKLLNMERQIKLTLLDLKNWRNLTDRTRWNDPLRMQQFKFLKPFVKNESSWERRLSVYWAHLKLVLLFHKNHSETNINPVQADVLESVNESTRQLLCMVQEYRSVTKRRNKLIDAEHMQTLINFNITDAIEIKIHIWYIMCRLNCFLQDMRKHVRQLRGKVNQAHRPDTGMNCRNCAYFNKYKSHNTKHQKQKVHQQPLAHNRNSQQNQTKQQQLNRRPKGQKGTRAPNGRVQNQQG
ncbi:uncharacterized protein LOC128712536 [Anopheles marshallii]|uniref:uncharacterized protein LOC128712536 n=1 Tax=Anopheles marshallii TaxID=1521116 RepID=UPI00237BC171|nr:uncharacterized protein LOC128712536 [Anopheles marshallii]